MSFAPIITISECKGDEESIMHCDNNGFGVVRSDCCNLFVHCNTKSSPQPFIATCHVAQTRFQISAVKLQATQCGLFCRAYGGITAIIDTKQEYGTVYRMIQKTNKEHSFRENYVIGLERSKLIS